MVEAGPGHLQGVLHGDHVVGLARGGGHGQVQLHQQVERAHGLQRLELVRPGRDGVAPVRNERAYAMFVLQQDLVRQRASRHAGGGIANTAGMHRLPEAIGVLRVGRQRLGDRLDELPQRRRVAHRIAGTLPPAAHTVQAQHQVFQQGGLARHIGAGARHGDPGAAGGERPGGSDQFIRGDTRRRRHRFGRKARDRLAQGVNTAHVVPDKVRIVQALGQDDVEHGGDQRNVVSRAHLQVLRGAPRGLRAARVDHEQFQAVGERVGEVSPGVGVGYTAGHRNQRVQAEQQDDVRIGKVGCRRHPAPEQGRGDHLAGLVDGIGTEPHGRADGLHEGRIDGAIDGRRGGGERAAVQRDTAVAVVLAQCGELFRYLVHRLLNGNIAVTAVGLPFLRVQQPVGVVALGAEILALYAAETLVHRVVRVAPHRHRRAVLDLDDDPAGGVAGAADSVVFLHKASPWRLE